jgi:hypothetical protein
MKFCYIDESGTGGEPFAVMAAIIVDGQRMGKTKQEWSEFLESLSDMIGTKVNEFHTRDFYPGNGPWRELKGPQRAEIITRIIDWIKDRKHKIISCVIEKSKWEAAFAVERIPPEIGSIWKTLAFYTALGIQKAHQNLEGNKGDSLLILDREVREEFDFSELILSPPAWSDSFYNKGKREPRLGSIVDVPYWADSKHVGLIQVSDFVSYFIRKYCELKSGASTPKYPGEADKLEEWMAKIHGASVPKTILLPSRGRCAAADILYNLSPEFIR